ncbi:hypothetical protein BV25DRAFT_1823397 [Artomyces pyxidatus]|uniref:Uncharacterized protein n=1 Tax=Artomyces pyxidatus TaxID=48021 RepID=A0ACB8T6B5_9AGAM|nr:hypothetical protein BV25DRAFT_1823397 [Artomyces pyxidatus]
MAVMFPTPSSSIPPFKRRRRTATSVFAGDFDPRPTRDVLTSLLNGVPINKSVETDDELKRERRREKKERDREKKRAKLAAKSREPSASADGNLPALADPVAPVIATPRPSHIFMDATFDWGSRPVVHLATAHRPNSVTPPPQESSPPTTPGPSVSSSTSRTSSKRPHTPQEDYDLDHSREIASASPHPPPQRKKRATTRKGWKGWVEGSPPPSEKLINLDAVQVLHERRTRSGKNFDAIGLGESHWV